MVQWALQQVEGRYLTAMKPYNFSTYCYLRMQLRQPPTDSLVVHMYKWVEAQVEAPSLQYKTRHMLNNLRYVFSQPPSEQLKDILFKKHIEFTLFEDVEPPNKPLEELLPRLFTDDQIA